MWKEFSFLVDLSYKIFIKEWRALIPLSSLACVLWLVTKGTSRAMLQHPGAVTAASSAFNCFFPCSSCCRACQMRPCCNVSRASSSCWPCWLGMSTAAKLHWKLLFSVHATYCTLLVAKRVQSLRLMAHQLVLQYASYYLCPAPKCYLLSIIAIKKQ